MRKLKLGIIGASGLVGQTILQVLKEEELLKFFDLYLITSEKNAGKRIIFNNKTYEYLPLNNTCVKMNFDIVIFSAGGDISKTWAPNFAEKGTYVIDNSNSFRHDTNVPLVIPEINECLITKSTKIIANPNCSTIQLALVLFQLKQLARLNQVVVSTYQSVSGAGRNALDDLKFGTNQVFKKGIMNNIIAQIGEIQENGFCKEENKIMSELNKILDDQIHIVATTVRVPVEYCHGESVYVKFAQKVDFDRLKNVLKCNFLKFSEHIYQNDDCVNTNHTYICRLRQVSDYEFVFFIFADNLRRGAGYNAVLILKRLLEVIKR